MADIRLDLPSEAPPSLPDVCLQCGVPATGRQVRTFSWSPWWTGVLVVLCSPLIFAAVGLILMKRRRLEVPLCEQHRDWWRWRQHLLMGSLIFNMVGGGVFMLCLDAFPSRDEGLFFSLAGIAVGLLVWLAAVFSLRVASPRPGKITTTSVKLWGVAEQFARAQQGGGALPSAQLDEAARKHWNPNDPRPHGDEEEHVQRAKERRTSPDGLQELS